MPALSIDYQAFREALEKAREDTGIACDCLEFFEDAAEAPIDIQVYDGMEHVVIAWRGQGWAYIALSSQLLERSPSLEMAATACCQDLDAHLDEAA